MNMGKQRRVTYSTGEVLRLAGLTHRQLDHWARRGFLGVVNAPGSGTNRVWRPEDAAVVLVLARVAPGTSGGDLRGFGRRAIAIAEAVRTVWRENRWSSHSLLCIGEDTVIVVGRSSLLAAVLSEPASVVLHLPVILAPLVESLGSAEVA